MKKILFTILILSSLAIVAPAPAKAEGSVFWAAVSKIAQELFEPSDEAEEIMDEDRVDPREIQQAIREIRDAKRELNKFAKIIQKTQNSADDLSQIDQLLQDLAGFERGINSGEDIRGAIQEFRDAQIWDEIQKWRAKIELPKQMKQWDKEIKKLEKILTQKKYQSLGLELGGVSSKLGEVKLELARIRELANSGEFEEAMEDFNSLRENMNPSDIANVVQRTYELMTKVKRIKNAEIKTQIQEIYAEVIENFNAGEYRTAWELMNESFGQIMNLINSATSVGKRGGQSKENFLRMTDQLQNQMKNKSEQKKEQFQGPGIQVPNQGMPSVGSQPGIRMPVRQIQPMEQIQPQQFQQLPQFQSVQPAPQPEPTR